MELHLYSQVRLAARCLNKGETFRKYRSFTGVRKHIRLILQLFDVVAWYVLTYSLDTGGAVRCRVSFGVAAPLRKVMFSRGMITRILLNLV
jgi:hypothetical protein